MNAEKENGVEGETGVNMCTGTASHDWRVNPFFVYLTNPPMQELRCAVCGASTYQHMTLADRQASPSDPKTWPHA